MVRKMRSPEEQKELYERFTAELQKKEMTAEQIAKKLGVYKTWYWAYRKRNALKNSPTMTVTTLEKPKRIYRQRETKVVEPTTSKVALVIGSPTEISKILAGNQWMN